MCDHEKASHSVADCGMTQHCPDVFVAESCARICLWRPQFSLFYYYNRILIEITCRYNIVALLTHYLYSTTATLLLLYYSRHVLTIDALYRCDFFNFVYDLKTRHCDGRRIN